MADWWKFAHSVTYITWTFAISVFNEYSFICKHKYLSIHTHKWAGVSHLVLTIHNVIQWLCCISRFQCGQKNLLYSFVRKQAHHWSPCCVRTPQIPGASMCHRGGPYAAFEGSEETSDSEWRTWQKHSPVSQRPAQTPRQKGPWYLQNNSVH